MAFLNEAATQPRAYVARARGVPQLHLSSFLSSDEAMQRLYEGAHVCVCRFGRLIAQRLLHLAAQCVPCALIKGPSYPLLIFPKL